MYMHVYTHIYVCMGKPIKYTPISLPGSII